MAKSYSYYQCPHKPTCRNDQSIGNKPCRECVGMNRHQVRCHTARQDLHRGCDPTCPVYDLDVASLMDYNFVPVNAQRKSIECPHSEDENTNPGKTSRRTRASTQQRSTTDEGKIASRPAKTIHRAATVSPYVRNVTSVSTDKNYSRRAVTASPYVRDVDSGGIDDDLPTRIIQRAAHTSPYSRDHNKHQPITDSPCADDNMEVTGETGSTNDTIRDNTRSRSDEPRTAPSSNLHSNQGHHMGRTIKNCLRYLLLCLIAAYLYSSWAHYTISVV
ncbi:hypothetical protein PSHT_09731 [Puccinia striiformis]|uniref:Uncharacterized protein n=3 Tax=Puccinia striiformis TaxID=27350 RepID=A0A2S4VEP5_9BASI|nr:hypothetical protein PSHT_09731 [Puccinia striiformis]